MENSRRDLLRFIIASSLLPLKPDTIEVGDSKTKNPQKESNGINKQKSTPRCSFCYKSEDEVRKLIAGAKAFICNECVSVCQEIIDDDREKRSLTHKIPCQKSSSLPCMKVIRLLSFKPKPGKGEQLLVVLSELMRKPLSEDNPFLVKWHQMDGQSVTLFLGGTSGSDFKIFVQHEVVFKDGHGLAASTLDNDCPKLIEFGNQVKELTEDYESEFWIGAVQWEQ
jgi:hypothetical protein